MATPSTILIAVLTFLSLAAHGAQQWLGNTGLTNDTPRIAYDKINTNFANLWAEVYTNLPAQIGSGGGGGGATNAVTKVNDLTNALQYFQIRTNAASAPTVNTNGFASKGTNFFDFPYAGNAVHGIMNSNDYRRLNGVWAEAQGVQSAVYGTNSTVSGGSNNVVYGLESYIGGGGGNMIQTNRHSAIAGGNHNAIWGNTDPDRASFIGAGEYNIITNSSAHSAIPAGLSNVIDNARYSFLGAWKSKIQGKQANGASNAAIASGWINTNEVKNSVIAGGYFNAIQYTNRLVDPDADQEGNFIGAGWNNTIRGGYGSAIVGGYSNQIVQLGAVGDQRQSSSFIGAGIQCKITGGSFYSAIADGVGNLIDGSSSGSFIGGGFNNRINGGSTGYIIGGSQNTNSGSNSLIGGGNFNTIGVGDSSAILSGFYNYLYAQESFIIGSHLTNDFTAGGSDFRIDMGYSEATKVTIDAASLTARGTLKGTGGADISGGITNGALTANRFVLADANKKLVSSANAVTDTEFGYLSGLSSSIQNQLAAKQTGSAILSNAVAAGVILTNTYTSSTSGTPVTNGIQNGRANFKNITGSGSVTITDQGTNIVIGSAAGGGNVVGPPSSTAFTLAPFADASGALLTNSLIATDSSRTNLFTPGYDRAYRVQGTNGIESLGWLHVAQKFTNDNSAFFGDTLNVAATATFANDILVTLASAFSSDLTIGGSAIHTGPVKYTMAAISASDIDWSLSSARSKTLSANTTFTFSNLADDRHVYVQLTEDATGTRTATWPTATWLQHTNQNGTLTAGGINTNANFVTVFHFWRTAGTVYGEVASTAPSRFGVEWESGSVPSSDVAVRVSDETGTDKLVFSSNSELSGTTRAATLAVTNLGTFGSINVTTQANVGGLTVTNLGTAGSFNVTTQLNAGAVTVTNSFQGLGSGINGIDALWSTNYLVQIGPQTNKSTLQVAGGGSSSLTTSNAWVGGTYYALNQGFTNKLGDAALTNAASVLVPKHMLTNNYDSVEIWTSGSAQMATATTNQIKFLYGSETILDTSLQGASNTAWRAQCTITRTGNTAQLYALSLWWGGNTYQLTNICIGGLQTNGIDTTFQVQLASRKPGGITNDWVNAKYYPAPR